MNQYKSTTILIASLVDELDDEATQAVYLVVRELHDRPKLKNRIT